jgi:hypothetical protein
VKSICEFSCSFSTSDHSGALWYIGSTGIERRGMAWILGELEVDDGNKTHDMLWGQ